MPLAEDGVLGPINPYGQTKLMAERILGDIAVSDPFWRAMLLRYFNPVGAHESGLIGEDPAGIPNNLMPFVAQVAVGRRPRLPSTAATTRRSTARACATISTSSTSRWDTSRRSRRSDPETPAASAINLGTGREHSVLEVVKAFEAASGCSVPYDIVARRQGDVATCYADPTRARKHLGWTAAWSRRDVRGCLALAIDEPHGFRAAAMPRRRKVRSAGIKGAVAGTARQLPSRCEVKQPQKQR
jgi:UDP-glucose 4-epimerase